MAYPPAPAPAPHPVQKQGNGFGVTALVLGLIGLIVFSWIPVINVFTAVPLGILALIFGIIGVAKAGSRGGKGKGTGGAGLVLGILAVGAAIVMNVWVFNEASDYIDDEWQRACDEAGLTEEECGDWEDWESDVESVE